MNLADARLALNRHFGHASFREGQEAIVDSVLGGHDTLAIMPTGGGKSICYQLPALMRPGTTVVVSPLIALMKDQVDALTRRGLAATCINSSLDPEEADSRLAAMANGAYKLVYVAPERFRSARFMARMGEVPVALFAVDEAHCVSQWGHDFRPDYLRLNHVLARLRPTETGRIRPPVLAATATATPEVRRDIIVQLGLHEPRVFVSGFDRPNLRLLVRHTPGEEAKRAKLRQILESVPGSGIVYTATRKNAQRVLEFLRELGISATCYHAGLDEDERTASQDAWISGRARIVVATNAFGMGVDKPDVRLVVHHDLPGTVEAYYQEAGRAGRDGKPAFCVLLFSEADRHLQEFFIEGSCPGLPVLDAVWQLLLAQGTPKVFLTQEEIARELPMKVNEMAVGTCLNLLERGGLVERLDRRDNLASIQLLDPEASVRGRLQESLMAALRDSYGNRLTTGIQADPALLSREAGLSREQTLSTLNGLAQRGILDYMPPFRGRGVAIARRVPLREGNLDLAMLGRKQERALGRLQAMIAYAGPVRCRRSCLLEYFGEAATGKAGHQPCGTCDRCVGAWGDRTPARPTAKKARPAERTARVPGSLPGDRQPLLTALRAERTRLAKADAVPAFVILSDRTLEELALHVPQDEEAMLAVKGIGARKLERYGLHFLPILARFGHLRGH